MKNIFAFFAIAALAVSCNIVPEPDVAIQEGDTLELSALCSTPQTRADGTMAGVDAYNENALTSIDYFIYPADATERTSAVMHDRWTLSTTDHASKVVNMSDYKKTYGTSGKVFMVANMPEKTGEEDTFSGRESVNDLRALPVPVTTFEQRDNGKFKAQDSFVMISEEWKSFTLSQNENVKVTVPLSRRAAKITLDIRAAKWFTEYHYDHDKVNGTYEQTWYPNLDNIQVYMLYHTNEGTMDGTPIDVKETTRFKSYNRWAYKSTISEDGGMVHVDANNTVAAKLVTGNPFYSYPSKWESKDVNAPFFKIILEWSSYEEDRIPTSTEPGDKKTLKQPNKEFYYKITIPDELDLKSNNWYKITLDLAVLGSEADDAYVTVPGKYSIVAWSDPDDAMGGDLNSGRYLTVGGNKTQEKVGNIVYETFVAYSDKIDIPIITSHPFEVINAASTYPSFQSPYSGGSLNYTEDDPETTADESSADGVNFRITPSEDFTYLTLEHNRIKNVNLNTYVSKDLAPITYTFEIQHTDDANYKRYIKVIQYPAIYAELREGGDVFVNGYFQFQTAMPASGFDRLTQRSYTFRNRNNNLSYTASGFRCDDGNGSGTMSTPNYGGIAYDGDLPRKMTLVTVTAFTEASQTYQSPGDPVKTYIIGDPRQQTKTWNSLDRRVIGRNGNGYQYANWTTNEINAIKVGTNNNENIIAPALLVSSRWGRPGDGYPTSLELAEKRCATYQEAGYPAGRWRLPTEAEIYFIYTLQNKGLVDGLFSSDITKQNYGYYASSGRVFDRHRITQDGGEGYGGTDYANRFTPGPYSGNPVSVRCVYDYWYWEEQDKSQNTYNPKP